MPAKAGPKVGVDRQYARATARVLREHEALLAADGPPPAGAAPPPSAAEKARRLRDVAPAAYLYGAGSPVLGEMGVEAWKVVLDDFLEEMELSKAACPVARMMAEQLLLAQHAVGRLHVRAATRTSPAEVAAYHAAVARLMTEFRRTSAALKAYGVGAGRRAAPAPRAKVHTPPGVRPARRAKKARRGKVASNHRIRGRHGGKKAAA